MGRKIKIFTTSFLIFTITHLFSKSTRLLSNHFLIFQNEKGIHNFWTKFWQSCHSDPSQAEPTGAKSKPRLAETYCGIMPFISSSYDGSSRRSSGSSDFSGLRGLDRFSSSRKSSVYERPSTYTSRYVKWVEILFEVTFYTTAYLSFFKLVIIVSRDLKGLFLAASPVPSNHSDLDGPTLSKNCSSVHRMDKTKKSTTNFGNFCVESLPILYQKLKNYFWLSKKHPLATINVMQLNVPTLKT